MKKISALILIVAMAMISCTKESKDEPYNSDGSPITQAQALEIVKEDVDYYDVVYVSKSIVKKGTKFCTYPHKYGQTPCDSWVVIINTEPSANSGPFFLYIYVDPYSGNADKDSWEWGFPDTFEFEVVKSIYMRKEDEPTIAISALSSVRASSFDDQSNNWAVIISGGVRSDVNWERYWNDCSAIYKCLRQTYNYSRERIIVVMSDGKSSGLDRRMNNETYMSSPLDLDGDGTDDINYSATRSNLSNVFNYLRGQVKSDEQVLIFVTDHGARRNNESYICLWNGEEISASEFTQEVKKINSGSRKHVVLGQCYSGGFIFPLSSCSNITVATASMKDELSWSSGDNLYDEFLYHWISAAAGRTPEGTVVDADRNYYAGVSAEENFRYAQNNERRKETPQYESSPDPMGEKYGLSGEEFGYPVFTSGPEHLTSDPNGYLFELSVLPSTYTTNWSSNNKVILQPVTGYSAKAFKNTEDAMAEDQVRVELTTPFKTYSFNSHVYLWESGISFTDHLIEGSLSSDTFFLPFGCPDVSSYQWMIDGVEYVENASAHFIDFYVTGEIPEEYAVSVSFENPLGGGTTIVRRFNR